MISNPINIGWRRKAVENRQHGQLKVPDAKGVVTRMGLISKNRYEPAIEMYVANNDIKFSRSSNTGIRKNITQD